MRCGSTFGLLVLAAISTGVCAEMLGAQTLSDPAFVWPSVPSDWIWRPVAPEAEAQHADLVISLDQQFYPCLFPFIDDYANAHGLTIATTKGTCAISAGLLSRKAIDVGGFCCATAQTDRPPDLRFHSVVIAAIALLVHPDNAVEEVTSSQAQGLFSGAITDWSSVIEPSDRNSLLGRLVAVSPFRSAGCGSQGALLRRGREQQERTFRDKHRNGLT